jgi:hypothetical protein
MKRRPEDALEPVLCIFPRWSCLGASSPSVSAGILRFTVATFRSAGTIVLSVLRGDGDLRIGYILGLLAVVALCEAALGPVCFLLKEPVRVKIFCDLWERARFTRNRGREIVVIDL